MVRTTAFLVVGLASVIARFACASVLAHSEHQAVGHGEVAPAHKTELEAFRTGLLADVVAGSPDVISAHAAAAGPALFRREQAKPAAPAMPSVAAHATTTAIADPPVEVAHAARAAALGPQTEQRRTAAGINWPGIMKIAWLTTSSFAFLAPAFYAQLNGLHWLAALFSAQAAASWAYQFCDAEAPQVLLGLPSGCPENVYTALRHLGHGLGYFICLQMALAFLGPEDPGLQHIEENAEAHLGDQARRRHFAEPMKDYSESVGLPWLMAPSGPRVPQDVIFFSRVVPGITLLAFLQTYSERHHFHWECMIWYATMLLLSVWTFWMKRREFAASVLLRLGFWRRVLQCMLLPLALIGTTFAVMEETGNHAFLHGMWHVVVSALAIFEVWRVLLGDSVTFTYDDPVRNPIVAHFILLAMPALGIATVLLTVVLDMTAHPSRGSVFTWPSLSMAVTRAPGEYVFMLGTMCTATSAAVTWRLVDMMCAYHEEMYQRSGERREVKRSIDKWVTQGSGSLKDSCKAVVATPSGGSTTNTPLPFRQAGQILGSIAVLMAFVGATMHGELRASFLIGFLTLEAIAIGFNTMSAFKYGVPNHARVLVAGMLLVNTMGFLGTFQDNVMIPDWMTVYREAIYNCHGAAMVGLYFLWPLTWVSEAQTVMPVLVQWHRVCS